MGHLRSRAAVAAGVGAALVATVAGTAAAQPVARPTLSACAFGGLLQREVAMRRGGAASGDTVFDRRLTEMAAADLDRMMVARRRAAEPAQQFPSSRMRIAQSSGWIGVQTSEISNVRETADGRSVLYCDYPVVVSVEPDSPAQRAGLEAGDTVVAYNGRDLRSGSEIPLDQLLVPNDTLRVSVRRDGRPLQLAVVVGRRQTTAAAWGAGDGRSMSYVIVTPTPAAGGRITLTPNPAPSAVAVEGARAAAERSQNERTQVVARMTRRPEGGPAAPAFSPMLLSFGWGTSALAGAQLVAVDDDLGAVIGTRSGVLVLKVADGTPASAAGLRAGDVITAAAGRTVTAPAMLQQTLARRVEDHTLPLRVVRKGKARDVTLKW